jgi:hypothetical protein
MMINVSLRPPLPDDRASPLLFASGGYQLIIGGLARSFDALPWRPAGSISPPPSMPFR